MNEATEKQQAQSGKPRFFRDEAVAHHMGGEHEANLLELGSGWVAWSYWLLLAVCAAAFLYAALGQLNEYATGTAVIRSAQRIDVSARAAGVIEAVLVRPGDRVDEGAPLVRLHASLQTAELTRIQDEIEQHLVEILRDPGDAAAQSALAGLQAQHDLAAAQLEERIIRAPRAGVVNHVAARPGESLELGELAVTLTGADTGFRVLAVLPGQYRPLIAPGMPLRLELEGYPYAYQAVEIESVSDEVVGPAEVRRYLPQSIADAFELTGPMVFVEAALPDRSFTVSGRSLDYYDGMAATAEVVVRSESILVRFVPGLRRLIEGL